MAGLLVLAMLVSMRGIRAWRRVSMEGYGMLGSMQVLLGMLLINDSTDVVGHPHLQPRKAVVADGAGD